LGFPLAGVDDYIRVGRLALGVLTLVTGIAVARAEVAVGAGVPFSADDLTAALALRGAPLVDIAVRSLAPTMVELATPLGRLQIDLGAARGASAARLVALQLVPMSLEPSLAGPFALPPAPRSVEDHGWMFGVTAGGGRGIEGTDLGVVAVRGDAMWASGAWRFGGSVGWLHEIRGADQGMPGVTADFAAIRAVGGVAIGPFELVAGPELAPYRMAGTPSGVTVGAGGSVRVLLLQSQTRGQAFATADLELFAHRLVVESAGMELAATPRAMVTVAVGLAWGGP
jgi:hypothetical protein